MTCLSSCKLHTLLMVAHSDNVFKCHIISKIISVSGTCCQHIAFFVHCMSGMTLYPNKFYIVVFLGFKESFPQIGILDGFIFPLLKSLAIHESIHFCLNASTRYFESEYNVTLHGALSASSPAIAAISSIRLLVVFCNPVIILYDGQYRFCQYIPKQRHILRARLDYPLRRHRYI